MERANEKHIEPTELADEDLEQVAGGVYRFVRAISLGGENGTNRQLWVTTAT